jgi:hypothetical protein
MAQQGDQGQPERDWRHPEGDPRGVPPATPPQWQQRDVPPSDPRNAAWQPYRPQQQDGGQWQQPYPPQPGYGQPPQPPYPPQPQYQPPRRRSWLRRHWLLSSFAGVIVIVIAIVAAVATSSHGPTSPAVASLAACTSHHPVTGRQWLQVTKDPDAAKGQCITVYGEVTQFDSVTGDSVFRAQAGGAKVAPEFGFVNYPTNALFDGSASQLSTLVQGDLFTAQVTVAGSQSYDTQIGGRTTVPVFRVDSVSRTGHLDT